MKLNALTLRLKFKWNDNFIIYSFKELFSYFWSDNIISDMLVGLGLLMIKTLFIDVHQGWPIPFSRVGRNLGQKSCWQFLFLSTVTECKTDQCAPPPRPTPFPPKVHLTNSPSLNF